VPPGIGETCSPVDQPSGLSFHHMKSAIEIANSADLLPISDVAGSEKQVMLCLREPSKGPVFGVNGGGTGSEYRRR